MTRRLMLLSYVSLILYFTVTTAHAQGTVTLSELQIAFWPEYDRSSMLVIYRATLAPGVTLPASLTFSIPAKYSPPMAVAYTDAQGRLLNLEFTTAASGEVMTISFNAPTANFQFEYYDTSLEVSSSTRRYAFAGVAAYPIQSLVLQVQQPTGASGLTATPALGSSTVGTDGLSYFTSVRNNVAAGEAIALELTYTKSDSALSFSNQPLTANTTAPASTTLASAPTASPTLIASIIVGLVGVGLVGAGLAWFIRSRNPAPASSTVSTARPRRLKGCPPRSKEIAASAPASSTDRPAAFCHECGARLQPEDVFCRNCGTKVRR